MGCDSRKEGHLFRGSAMQETGVSLGLLTAAQPGKPDSRPGSTHAQATSDRKPRIGEMLVSAGLITPSDVAEALQVQKKQGGKTVEILVKMGKLTVKDFAAFLSRECHFASIDLCNYRVPRDLISLIPREFAQKHQILPIDRMGTHLTVAMACPLDTVTLEGIEGLTGLRVRALLCRADELETAIGVLYQSAEYSAAGTEAASPEALAQCAAEALRHDFVGALVKRVSSLPPMPGIVERVRAAIEDSTTSVRHIAEIVATDPATAAKVLSLANSAAVGYAGRVTSIDLAVRVLGLQETYHLVLSLAAFDHFRNAEGVDCNRVWRHSVVCATAADLLARATGYQKPGEVFCAALIHDIGRLALMQVMPAAYARIDPALCGMDLAEVERDLFFLPHTEVGYVLAMRWGLPAQCTDAIRYHHQPGLAPEPSPTLELTAAAVALLEIPAGDDLESGLANRGMAALDRLHLDEEALAAIRVQALAAPLEDEPSNFSY